jgi:hypothetical protein
MMTHRELLQMFRGSNCDVKKVGAIFDPPLTTFEAIVKKIQANEVDHKKLLEAIKSSPVKAKAPAKKAKTAAKSEKAAEEPAEKPATKR